MIALLEFLISLFTGNRNQDPPEDIQPHPGDVVRRDPVPAADPIPEPLESPPENVAQKVKGDFSHVTVSDVETHLAESLKPFARDFVEAGQKYGLDPRFLASISMLETGRGTSSAFRNKNNAMGISDRNGPVHCSSVADSIHRQSKSLTRPGGYYTGAHTIEEIGAIYSPPGAGNDPHGTNGGWPSHVASFYEKFLGSDNRKQVRVVNAPPEFPGELKRGDSGENVKYVQEILQREGNFTGTPLGNFKTLTEEAVKYFQGTHIAEDGEFLEVTGIVDERTWWALHNANGSAQRSFISSSEEVEVESKGRVAILALCKKLHAKGIREIPNGSNWGGYVTKIIKACGLGFAIPWCMAAVSYVYHRVTGEKPLGAMHVSCHQFWNLAIDEGKAHRKRDYVPIPGDIAIYSYGRVHSNGKFYGSGHATIVARVSESGKSHNAYEGNAGNRYKYSIRNESEGSLVGYVNLFGDEKDRPKFKRGTTKAPVVTLSLAESR